MGIGPMWVKYFTPQITSTADIVSWMQLCEAETGRNVDLLVVDYADKLTDARAKKDQQSKYALMEFVYESLRVAAVDRKCWCWTASQSTVKGVDKPRKGEKKAALDMDAVADSSNKVRVADLVVTLNYDDAMDEMTFFVAKNRTGQSRRKVGPVRADYAYGYVSRPNAITVAREIQPDVSPADLLAKQVAVNALLDDSWGTKT
jgi:hypothetical protein